MLTVTTLTANVNASGTAQVVRRRQVLSRSVQNGMPRLEFKPAKPVITSQHQTATFQNELANWRAFRL